MHITSATVFDLLRTPDMEVIDWAIICKHPGKGRYECRDIETGEFLPPARCRKVVGSLIKARVRNGMGKGLCES